MTDILEGLAARNLDHVIGSVFRRLSHRDVSSCRRVSRRWSRIVRDRVAARWTEAERCRHGWMEGRLRLEPLPQGDTLGIERTTLCATTVRYLLGQRGDCFLEYHWAGGDQVGIH